MDDAIEIGTCSIEQLAHFQCPHCQKWWSIGDPDIYQTRWACPWCGTASIFDLEQALRQQRR
jgi:predicted RNA-binding Zn-ribbon protein involved in translation (DUF1610 family)